MTLSCEQKRAKLASSLPVVRARAYALARRLPRHVDVDDLISVGQLAVLEALERATDEYGFECYAAVRIRGAMLDELRRNDLLSRDERDLADRVRDAEHSLTAETCAHPDAGALARRLGVPVDTVHSSRAASQSRKAVPIEDATVSAPARELDMLPHQLERAASALPRRLRAVLRMRFVEERTLTEIGDSLGVTESRSSQLVRDAVQLLRHELHQPPRWRHTIRTVTPPPPPRAPRLRIVSSRKSKEPIRSAPRSRVRETRLRAVASDAPSHVRKDSAHYKVICISMYTRDLARLDALVKELKRHGVTAANRSALIRYAVDKVNVNDIAAEQAPRKVGRR